MPSLPIDVVPGRGPMRFRWSYTTDTMVGPKTTECEGSLAPSAEGPVANLISVAKQQAAEIEELRRQVRGHCDRIAQQSELLSERAERAESVPAPVAVAESQQSNRGKRGK